MKIDFSQQKSAASNEVFAQLLGNKKDIQPLKIELLVPYGQQPFKPYTKDALEELSRDIKENGILSPIIVREGKYGKYQILAGHNRVQAAKLAQLEEVPAMIKDVDDITAELIMLNTNLNQRQELLPSEKAFAYKMQLEAIKRQGQRVDLTYTQVGHKSDEGKKSVEIVAEQAGSSRNQIQRFIRLTYLDKELLELVDSKNIPVNAGVALSYLDEDNQNELLDYMDTKKIYTITLEQGEKLKALKEESIEEEMLDEVFDRNKAKRKGVSPCVVRIILPFEYFSQKLQQGEKKIQPDEELLKRIAQTIEEYYEGEE